MAGTFNILKPIYLKDTYANIDYLYGPYESVAAANAAIPEERRAMGLTVGIHESQGIVEYWYKAGTTDADLVTKVAETVPKLEYTEEYPEGTVLRAEEGNPLTVSVKFTSQTYGQCTLTVYKDGVKIKTIKTEKGIIPINLGTSPEGSFTYEITGVDALTIPANERLVFKAVVGGAKISTDFEDTLQETINTSSNIRITYTASVADTAKTVKVKGELRSGSSVITTYNKIGSGNVPSRIEGEVWELGVISNPGSYTLTMYAYTGNNPQDTSGDNVSTNVSYDFVLMNAGEFIMTSPISSYSCDTNTAVSIPFRIYCGSRMQLQAHGVLLDGNGQTVQNYSLNRTVWSNTLNYWSLGKIYNEGNYTIRLWATTVGGESPTANVNIPTVVTPYEAEYEVITSGLVAEFTADGKSNNNDADTAGVWRNSVQGSNIYFELTDLNYNTNGWKHVDETIPDSEPSGEMMLKFTGDSYGRLKQMTGLVPSANDPDYLPMTGLSSSASTGFTAEVIYRTRCIGELNAKVITGHTGSGTNTSGFSASYNKVTVGSDDGTVSLDSSEDEWIHATMVIDKTIHTDVDDVQDYAPRKLMTIYINGSACAASIINDNMNFTNYGPVLLNAAFNTLYNRVDFFGACEIKAIRFYNRSLRASEVVNNYIASIENPETQATIAGRNGDVLPIVRFININAEHPKNPMKSDERLVSFADLNQMTEKSRQKKEYVCARILYQENSESEIIEWPRCTVQTQGTSTLAFPVKNYKIRFFADEDNPDGSNKYKTKLYTDKFADKGWQDEYVYTLKCDYMEAAHLNNTPSCEFYNEMIDTLVEDGTIATGWDTNHTTYTSANDQRTPSRREEKFDAIKGFPCLVYYYESENDYYANNGVYVGSYMFNLDKAADSLGFDAPAILDEDGETVIPVNNPRYTPGGDQPQTLSNICQSFEGVANGSDTAGCFFSYEDWKTSHYNAYLEYAFSLYNGPIDNLDDFVDYYLAHPSEQYRDPSIVPSDEYYNDGGYLMEKEDYITAEGKFADEYDYFASDFEMRYDWDDIEEGGEEYWGNSQWGLKRMIDWVSSASSTAGLEGANDIFRTEFENYFNLKYVLLYYLQMMVFGQVDNAGKNSMWDTWDGIHWAPRPYDLDTMAGLDNTGFEVINPDAELLRELSPFMNINSTTGASGYSEDISPLANIRYRAYNTRTSKFWKAFATSFATEIKAAYKHLRDGGVYTIEHIMEKFKSKTSDIIGEVYYNRDMATKFYKMADIDTFISRMHGNRIQRFKAWMTNRIIFCDTLFDYTSITESLNNNIIMRSDALESGSTISVSIGIKTYSPQYVRIDVGSGYDAKIEAYCSPDAQYIDPITGDTYEGTLFTIPLAAGDKEIQISGGGNIREIVNLGALKPKSLTLNNAKKLISLDVSYSTKLLALSLSNNTYLQYLDARGSVQLGSDVSGAQLDLSNCQNLKYVYLDNTKLQSVVFPTGGSLKEISAVNTSITGISLDSLHFLTSIDIDNCKNLLSYSITNCPKIEELEISDLPLTSVSISYCENLERLYLESDNSIASLYIASCPKIELLSFKNSRSNSMSTLDLTTLFSLNSLDISGSTVHIVKFPRNESATSQVPWGESLVTFNLTGSEIEFVQYGETASEGVDMGQLTSLTSISFNNCINAEHILNLNYTGSCSRLFSGCTSLLSVDGSLTCNGSALNLFENCYVLEDVSSLSLNFSGCTSLQRAFYKCSKLTYATIKRFLDSCGTSMTNMVEMCRDKGASTTYTSQDTAYTVLPANFFGNCKYVTDAGTSFYNAQLTSVPENAFVDSSNNPGLQRCTTANIMFASNPKITSLPVNVMKKMPALQNARGMWFGCSGITTTLPADFFDQGTGTSTITSVFGTFSGCSKLVVNMNNLGSILTPLTNLTDCQQLFMNCTLCTGTVPEGFFAANTRLTTVACCFAGTKITGIPATGSLFRANGDTSTTFNSLTRITGLFQSCSELLTPPNENLFAGCSYVTQAGAATLSGPGGGNLTCYGPFHNCTKITSFSRDLLMTMPRIQNLNGFFRGCTSLVYQTGGGFDGAMLSSHDKLTYVDEMFRDCTALTITRIPQMLTASKGTILSASGMFRGCTNISDFDEDLFTNMPRLTSLAYVFAGCTSLSTPLTSISPFAGCTALVSVEGAFQDSSISGSVPVTLFNDCRSTLRYTIKTFRGCQSLDGVIQVGNEDTVSVDSPTFQLGLLAECTNLSSTSEMFYGCKNISEKIPWDIFWTRSAAITYNQLENIQYMFYSCGFNLPTTVDDVDYLFHPDMFKKLLAVKNMEALFHKEASMTNPWSNSYPVHPNAFDGQYFVTNIKELFRNCKGLGGVVSNNWFINSITKITNAYGAFSSTMLTGVGPTFLRVNANTPNTTLTSASRMFYNCSHIDGNLPAMNDVRLYSKINYSNPDSGFLGYAYNCVEADNYSSFEEPWTRNLNYFG